MRLFVLCALLGAALPAHGASWVVFPVHCSAQPPSDPTLLRLSKELGGVIHAAVGADVRVVSRDARDERCPAEDGRCPPDVAWRMEAEHAVSLALDEAFTTLKVRVYAGRALKSEAQLPCRWEDGAVRCDTERLAQLLATPEVRPPFDEAQVRQAFERVRGPVDRCLEQAVAPAPPGLTALVRLLPEGRVTDVRIEPRELQGEEAYACAARMVEGLSIPPFAGKEARGFRFVLKAAPPPAEKSARRRRGR